MKRLDTQSQNFLRSPRLVHELVGHTTIKKSDTVLEIGAGSGVITSVLAKRVKHVIAYEYDQRVIKRLRDNMSRFDNVTLVQGDFLIADLPVIPYKVFANIPFHLSSPIIRKLTESNHRPQAIYLIVQKQFAYKFLIDKPGFTGMLGAQVAPLYVARIRQKLQKSDFWPKPAVDTVLLELKLRDEQLLPEVKMATYRNFVANCFNDPRQYSQAGGSNKKPSELKTDEWLELFTRQK
jgi:16S rRNA A1518/A1519 N6-dimethyltransferase RsmA/KsgA/DIM1 with predicted DNA glycosylase/AP lyase activity